MNNLRLAILAGIGLQVVSPLAAADGDHSGHDEAAHHTLEEIVVSADPLDRSSQHIVQPTGILDEQALARRDMRSIGETVAGELGVSSSDFGPGVGRPIIRGLSGARVRVLEDGIGTLDVSTVSPDHAVGLEPIFAEQVEIYRGPAALLYGSGATGGFVNVVSERIPERLPEGLSGEAYAHYDSASDGYLTALELDHGIGNLAVHFDAMKRDTNDIDIPGFGPAEPDEDVREGTLENSDSDAEAFSGGLSWIGTRGFFGVAISATDNQYGVPGHSHAHEDEHDDDHDDHDEEEGEEGVRIEQEQLRFDVKGELDAPLPGIERAKLRWAYNDHELAEIEGGAEVAALLENREMEGRLELVHAPLGGWRGAFGLQYRDREFESTGEETFLPDANLDTVGVFILEQRDIGDWHLEAGARYEHQWADSFGVDTRHDLFNVSVGTSWRFMDDHQVGIAYVHANRAPSIEELFSDGAHLATNTFEIGNADLDKEISNNVDLSIARVAGRWTWQVNAFYNRIDDFIFLQENDLNGDGIADRVEPDFAGDPAGIAPADEIDELLLVNYSQADAEFYGFEAETVLDLLDDARGHLDLRLWGDYVRARLIGGGDLPRIPPHRFGTTLRWDRGPWSAQLDYMRTGKQASTAALESSTAGFDLLGIDLRYTRRVGGADWTGFVRATNLFDETARRHVSFLKDEAPLPGRAALVGLRVRF